MDSAAKVKDEKPGTPQQQHLTHHQQFQNRQQSPQPRLSHQQQQLCHLQQLPYQQLQAILSLQNKGSVAGGNERHVTAVISGSNLQRDSSLQLEELAQLISDSIGPDMNTPSTPITPNISNSNSKADKCAAIVQQIKTENISSIQSSNAVQQSHVSSSKPSFVPNDLLGSILLKALNGFLFLVNKQGKVEFISENVTQFLKYTQDELIGTSIYNIIHVGDHTQFNNSLLPMTLTSGLAWPNDSPSSKGSNFHCRLLIKPPTEEKDEVDVKPSYVSQYENMQITAILQSSLTHKLSDPQFNFLQSRDDQTCLLCIARRLPMNEKNNMMIGGISQFSTKQDLNGKIIRAETSQGMVNLEGELITDFCHVNDLQQLKKHSQDVLKNGHNTSGVYRFKVAENRYVFVQTKSKLFNNHVTCEPDFIISTHTVIRECDSDLELRGHASTSLMKSIIGQSLNKGTPISLSSSNQTSAQSTQQSNAIVGTGVGMMDSTITELDDLADWDNFINSQSDSLDIKPMVSDGAISSVNNSWETTSMKSPASTSIPSPLQYALQSGLASSSGHIKRPPVMSMSQRSNSIASFEVSQKNPRFTPSPGSAPRSAGFNQRLLGNYPNQRSPASMTMGGGTGLQQNRSQGGQYSLGFPTKTLASPLMSPQSGYPLSPAGWLQSPSSVPPTPPTLGDFTQSLNTPLAMPLSSPLHNLQSQDSNSQSGLTSLDINNGRRSGSSSAFSSSSFLLVSSPVYSTATDFNGHQQPGLVSIAGNNSNNNNTNAGVSSQRLCQLLTQNTMLESLHSPVSLDGRRPIMSRGNPSSSHTGSTISPTHPVSSSNNGLSSTSSSGAISNMSIDLHRPNNFNIVMSPDNHLYQSPTEGPGQSPPQKPQSTSNEDSEMEVSDVTGIDSSNTTISHTNNSNSRVAAGLSGSSNLQNIVANGGDRGNQILKTLLSQDDDDELATLDANMSSAQLSSVGYVSSSPSFNLLTEKNEAEPRKNNALLKQLLGEEAKKANRKELNEKLRREIAENSTKSPTTNFQKSNSASSGSTTTSSSSAVATTKKRKPKTGRELLNHLLDHSDDEDLGTGGITTSAPAESTSTELEADPGCRSRHQSENQEPQSTSTPASHSEPCTPQGQPVQKRMNSVSDNMRRGGQQLDELLHNLWSKDDFSPSHQQHQVPSSSSNSSNGSSSNKRRKMSLHDVDSSDGVGVDMEQPSTSSSASGPTAQQSELSQKNVLLTQLLSRKALKETVVNTNISNPTGVPQSRYPRNLLDKIITIKDKEEQDNVAMGKNSHNQMGDNQEIIFLGNTANNSIAPSLSVSSTITVSTNSSSMPNFLSNDFSSGQTSIETNSNLNGLDAMSSESQLSQLQSFIDGDVALFNDTLVSESMSGLGHVDSTETDPLLQQILQQAADLQEDLQKKMGEHSEMSPTHQPVGVLMSGMGGGINSVIGLNINTNISAVSSIAQPLSSSVQSVMQSNMINLQQQQQPLQQQQERLRLLSSSQKFLQHQLIQQKQQQQQQQYHQKSQDSNLLSLSQHQSFVSPAQRPSSTMSIPQLSLSVTSFSTSLTSSLSTSQPNQQQQQSMLTEIVVDDESNLVAQLEEIFKETGNWPNMDNFMPNSSQSRQDQSNEQLVIDGIKRQLMGEEPLISPHQQQQQQLLSDIVDNNTLINRQNLQHSLQQKLLGGVSIHQQLGQVNIGQGVASYNSNGQGLRQGVQEAFGPNMPGLQSQQQPRHLQQPGFTPHRGSLGTASLAGVSQLRPTGVNTAIMVRQNLLYQQRHRQIDRQKQDREKQQRLLQLQQQQQRLQSQQFSPHFSQTGVSSIDSQVSPQIPFPDNLRELMTQGHPPNVTLPVQRGQGMPGPMSPRFPNPSPQSSQLSPHYSPQPGSGGVWSMRPQSHTEAFGIQQGNQFSPNMNRQRSLSGNSLPSPSTQQQQQQQHHQQQQQQQHARFQFADGHFSNNSGVGGNSGSSGQISGLFSPQSGQQQQPGMPGMFQQSRIMHRLPVGHGSPVASHSSFATSPTDPLLNSPQAVMSPSAGMRQGQQGVQVSPQYSQVSVSTGYGGQAANMSSSQVSFQTGSVSSFSPGSSMSQSTASALHEFDLQLFDTTYSSLESKNLANDMGVGNAGSSTSQYVKQELRNICSARSEKQQQQQQLSQLQPLDFDSSSSELPPDILETINDMSKEHGGPLSSPLGEAEAVSQLRLEARRRCEQFQRLSASGQPAAPVSDPSEEAGVKATSLFRNQLLRPVHNLPSPVPNCMKQMPQSTNKVNDPVSQISILQSESRTPVDDIRPADNRNSLLCQLLSE